jgi:Flp pilus assembly protein CpaB
VLPTLTARARRFPRRRLLSAAASAVLLALALGYGALPPQEAGPPPPRLAERLPTSSWAFAIPTSWFAAPAPDLRPGDRVDVLALRSATSAAIAFDLEVMSADDRTLVVGVTALDASALAAARAAGQLLVPLLRSTK